MTEKELMQTLLVGKLYYRPESKEYLEYIKTLDNGMHQFKVDSGKFVDYNSTHMQNAIPVEELKGLRIGDIVYTPSLNSQPIQYTIKHVMGKILFIETREYNIAFAVNIDGTTDFVSAGKQLFWRTADRAKRFGRKES